MILSIIIPMYKVEKYIGKCLRSCLNQDLPYSDYEILCVNDGSPDSSAAIAEDFVRRYPNIRVINQENFGLSVARNNGLENAIGDYVWFVDSDDWIESNCLKRITSKLKGNIDILQLQYRHTYENSDIRKEFAPIIIEHTKSGKDITAEGGLPAPAQFCVYRRGFLIENKLKFIPGIYHEDSEFKPRAVYMAKQIASDNEVSYNYLQRKSGSIMSSFSEKRAKDILFVNNRLYNFGRSVDERCVTTFYRMIGTNMNTLLFGYRGLNEKGKNQVRTMLLKDKLFFRCMIKSRKVKYIVEGIVFCIDVKLGFLLHRMIR